MSSILWLIETFVSLFLCIKCKIIIPINAVITDGTSTHIKIKFKGLNFDSVSFSSSFEIVKVEVSGLIEMTVGVSVEVLVDVLIEVIFEELLDVLVSTSFEFVEVILIDVKEVVDKEGEDVEVLVDVKVKRKLVKFRVEVELIAVVVEVELIVVEVEELVVVEVFNSEGIISTNLI